MFNNLLKASAIWLLKSASFVVRRGEHTNAPKNLRSPCAPCEEFRVGIRACLLLWGVDIYALQNTYIIQKTFIYFCPADFFLPCNIHIFFSWWVHHPNPPQATPLVLTDAKKHTWSGCAASRRMSRCAPTKTLKAYHYYTIPPLYTKEISAWRKNPLIKLNWHKEDSC